MTKQEIRQVYLEKRKALSPAEQAKFDDLLLIRFQSANIPFIQTLLSYWPIEKNKEPNTHLFTDYIEFTNPGLTVYYPKTDFIHDKMTAVSADEHTEFIINGPGIYEPASGDEIKAADLDMIFVPLLAFDIKGYRVGYGKGFYDKYLSQCRDSCLKIGFSYFEPIAEMADKHDFDVPLDLCITPQTVYVF